MSYDLESFTAESRAILATDPGPKGREKVRALLETLLQDREFVRRYCTDATPGLHLIYEDPDLKFQVLAHINRNPRVSPPHDHGASWAIYGQATEHTDMTEWKRLDNGSDPVQAELEAQKTYRLTPGHAAIYQDGTIHSIDYPANSCFVRVTGTNLDQIPRVMFDLKTGAVRQMTTQRAS